MTSRHLIRLVALATGLMTSIYPATAQYRAEKTDTFEHYVLSISWSPSFCAAEGNDTNAAQCNGIRPYAFLVHGLWPQYHRGYPEYCRSDEPGRVATNLAAQYLDIIPSIGLIGHQWRKHGTCTGLDQQDYLRLTRKAWNRIKIPPELSHLQQPLMISPDQVEARFMAVNTGLKDDAIAISCDRRYMREVRICMTKDLEFKSCESVNRNSCRLNRVLMPPVRASRQLR